MRLVFPNSHRINRGNYVVKELAEACRANEVTDLVILHETRGVPGQYFPLDPSISVLSHSHFHWYICIADAMIVSHFPHGPTIFFSLHSVALRHDLPNANSSTVSEQYPHLIFEAFSSKLGKIGDSTTLLRSLKSLTTPHPVAGLWLTNFKAHGYVIRSSIYSQYRKKMRLESWVS